MRISLVSEHADPTAALGGADAGGQNVHVAALAAGLAARGHDVVVHTRLASPRAKRREVTPDGYVVDRVPAGPPAEVPKDDLLPHLGELGDGLRRRWDAEGAPDVVHAHFWMSGLATLHARRGLDLPVVQTFHALGSVKKREQGARDTSPAERVALERRLCRHVDHVVATCRDEVRELRLLGLDQRRASVVPCGVDTDHFVPGRAARGVAPAGRRPVLLALGRLVERKGIGDVVRALPALPDVDLVVAGGPPADGLDVDPEVERLRRMAIACGVADRVRFVGAVDHDRVPALIASSDVVVTAPWYEPFGIVPLEAMACARPVIGTAVGGLLDTVVPGVTGELVQPRRPDLLAGALAPLLADPARRTAYGEAGRARVLERFTWDRVVDEHVRVYERLAARSQPATATTATEATR
jgi:glycosyltransferase involved in cell wall biosynthesis